MILIILMILFVIYLNTKYIQSNIYTTTTKNYIMRFLLKREFHISMTQFTPHIVSEKSYTLNITRKIVLTIKHNIHYTYI